MKKFKVTKNNKIVIYVLIGVIGLSLIGFFYSPSFGKVNFRTSNLFYGWDSVIAYSDICGNELVAYGQTGGLAERGEGTCDNAQGLGGIDLTYVMDVPGEVTEDGETKIFDYDKTVLYKDSNSLLYVCSSIKDGNGYAMLMYSKDIEIPFIEIDLIPTSLNPQLEGKC